MNNTVPCPHPDKCGVTSHIAGSDAHTQCMKIAHTLGAQSSTSVTPSVTPTVGAPSSFSQGQKTVNKNDLNDMLQNLSNTVYSHIHFDVYRENGDIDVDIDYNDPRGRNPNNGAWIYTYHHISVPEGTTYSDFISRFSQLAIEHDDDIHGREENTNEDDVDWFKAEFEVDMENVANDLKNYIEPPSFTDNGLIMLPNGDTGRYANKLFLDRGLVEVKEKPIEVVDDTMTIWTDTCDIYDYTTFMDGEDKYKKWAVAISIASIYDFDESEYERNADTIKRYIESNGVDADEVYKILKEIN